MHTKKNIYSRKRFWAGILLAQFILFYIFSKVEFFVDVFAEFFESQKYLHQNIFAFLPISIGDIVYILLGLLLFYFLFKILKKKSRARFSLKFLILLNVLYFIYQLFWGMLYFQRPILEKLPKEKITLAETKLLALEYLKRCQQSRNHVEEDESGVFRISNLDQTKEEIINNQAELPQFFNTKVATDINAIKPSLFRQIMSYTGILGYYNPFTAEAQYNPTLPATHLPITIAHESAHQLGYAREQEASFIGFLLGKDSDNAAVRYSSEYFVLKSLLAALIEKNPDFVEEVLSQYSVGMKRDRQAEKDFVKRHQGFLNTFFGFTNDLFLKSNRQQGSITYSYFVDLLVRYERLDEKR